MRRLFKLLLVVVGIYLLLAAVAGVVVGEGSLKLRRLPLRHRQEIAALVRDKYHAGLQDISLQAADGVTLRAWYVRPQQFNGSAVILLHGITDNREGVAGYGKIFLDHGYAILLPDARRHGESGGEIATYGVKESDDIHRWVDWLYARDLVPSQCVYGFGESYGAALMLQSLAVETRFCAVAVESAFSTAREMSYERISRPLHLKPWFGRTLGLPVIASAVIYARLRYGIDLLQPSPLEAVEHSQVPVLLIHGDQDRNISPRHAVILAKAAPNHVQLWLVPGAGHTMAWAVAHQEFETRLLEWFQLHGKDGRPAAQVSATGQ
jgi:dipeptidyl aminopeptidase/acylaminoacyl peptidase